MEEPKRPVESDRAEVFWTISLLALSFICMFIVLIEAPDVATFFIYSYFFCWGCKMMWDTIKEYRLVKEIETDLKEL